MLILLLNFILGRYKFFRGLKRVISWLWYLNSRWLFWILIYFLNDFRRRFWWLLFFLWWVLILIFEWKWVFVLNFWIVVRLYVMVIFFIVLLIWFRFCCWNFFFLNVLFIILLCCIICCVIYMNFFGFIVFLYIL